MFDLYTVLEYTPIIWEGMIYIYAILCQFNPTKKKYKFELMSMLIKLGLILLSQFSYLEPTSATTVCPDVQWIFLTVCVYR